MRPVLLLFLIVALLSGCGALQLNPVATESRAVQSVSDAAKTLTVTDGMVWYDAAPATRGLRFPPGRYTLEAEDADYWYFRAPAPLEFRIFADGKITDSRDIPGGLMLAKRFNLLPAAGYIDDEPGRKMLVWKLGQEFLRLEHRNWQKNF